MPPDGGGWLGDSPGSGWRWWLASAGFAAYASPDSGSPPRLPAGIRRGISLVSLTNAGQANLGLGVLAMDARLSGLVPRRSVVRIADHSHAILTLSGDCVAETAEVTYQADSR